MHNNIYDTFNGIDNKEWIDILLKTPDTPVVNGVSFPGLPDAKVQISTVGGAGANALLRASMFYREIHGYAHKTGLTFTPDTRILDFGCGFGRILRFFMKDVAPGNLIGTDVQSKFVDICNDSFQRSVTFDRNEPFPPLKYPDASFDVIYAFSIFSHLSEQAHLQWLKEFHRIIKPGGLVFLTLRQEQFIYFQNSMLDKVNTFINNSAYNSALAKYFGDLGTIMPRYKSGEYIYKAVLPNNVLTQDFYGETVIPPDYIKRVWSQYFTVVDSFDSLQRLEQALVVLTPNGQEGRRLRTSANPTCTATQKTMLNSDTEIMRENNFVNKLLYSNNNININGLHFFLEHRDYTKKTTQEEILLCKSFALLKDYIDLFTKTPHKKILELGIFEGGSALFMASAFKQIEKIVSVDLRKENLIVRDIIEKNNLTDKITLYYGTSQDSPVVSDIVARDLNNKPDIIIDDCSHRYAPTKASFAMLFPLLAPGGLYIIEDWGWAHWEGYQQADSPFSNVPALSNFIFELIALKGTHSYLFEDIIIKSAAMIIIQKSYSNVQLATPMNIDAMIKFRGKKIPLL